MSILLRDFDDSDARIEFSYDSTLGDFPGLVALKSHASDDQIFIEFPFTLENIPSEYSVSILTFKNQYYSQADLFEIRATEKASSSGRIGYMFMLRALLDNENSIFDRHTFPFAQHAFKALISGSAKIKPKVPADRRETYSLIDFYDEDLILVVLCDQLTSEIPNFSFIDYIFAFYLHGFVFLKENDLEFEYNDIDFIKGNFESIRTSPYQGRYRWSISAASEIARSEYFPAILAQELILEKHHFLSKFHILYQVIEILIMEVLRHEILTFVSDGSNHSGHKLKKRMSLISTDGYRISRLLNEYSRIPNQLEAILVDKVKEFFLEIKLNFSSEEGESESKKLAALIYQFRNNLVHNYRIIHRDSSKLAKYLNLLHEINQYFECLVFELLHTFRAPAASVSSVLPSDMRP